MSDEATRPVSWLRRLAAAASENATFFRTAVVVAVAGLLAIAAAGTYLAAGRYTQGRLYPAAGEGTASPEGPLATTASGTIVHLRDFVAWRDEAGVAHRAAVDPVKLNAFLVERRSVLDAAVNKVREIAAANLRAALDPVFAETAGRIPQYADWYFSYITRYILMSHVVAAALEYELKPLFTKEPDAAGFVKSVESHLVDDLKREYADRVLHPDATSRNLDDAFERSAAALGAELSRVASDHAAAMRKFIAEAAHDAKAVDPASSAAAPLDWDGRPSASQSARRDIYEIYVLAIVQKGLLTPVVIFPRNADRETAPSMREPSTSENVDEVTHVIMSLFSKVVDSAVSEVASAFAGIAAGIVAGGVAGSGVTGVVTAGASVAVPLGAAIGFASIVTADVISNRIEENLARQEFESNLGQALLDARKDVEVKMTAAFNQRINDWYAETQHPTAGRAIP